ncbi:hypothetical protein EV426DRAFT_706510 [Tirmania nivea]|nr:hypothetical protein EV426DRAFT_706510 [Tirmania nivea]
MEWYTCNRHGSETIYNNTEWKSLIARFRTQVVPKIIIVECKWLELVNRQESRSEEQETENKTAPPTRVKPKQKKLTSIYASPAKKNKKAISEEILAETDEEQLLLEPAYPTKLKGKSRT